MIEDNHTPKEKEFFRRTAIDCGYLITSSPDLRLIAVPKNMQCKFGERLKEVIASLHYAIGHLPHDLERELSKFLSPETLDQIRQEQSSVLLHSLNRLQVHDLQTEVLIQWKAEFETSASSSVQDGESVGELPTPSRTETVAASCDTEEAARTHGGVA